MHKYFIGQIFWNPEIIAKTVVEEDDIPTSKERAIFKAMKYINYIGEVINELSVSKESGIPLSEILSYKSTNIMVSQWRYYEKQIIEQSRQMKIRKVAEEIMNGQLPADEMIARFSEATALLNNREGNKVWTLGECITDSLKEFEQRAKDNRLPGIPTGFSRLDAIFGGFQRRRLYYVGARPSQGKSALLMNFAMNCNVACAFFTAESNQIELSNRMIIRMGRLNSHQFMNGIATRGDYQKMFDASQTLFGKPMHVFYEGGMPIHKVVSLATELKRTNGIGALFIDYIQLLDPFDKKVPRNEQISEISRRLKQLAVDLDIPIIAAAQLRRDAEGNKPKLNDFSDSTQIERDADVAMMIYNIREKGTPAIKDSYICVEKNRDGELRDIKVDFFPHHFHFQEALDTPTKQVVEKEEMAIGKVDEKVEEEMLF